MTDFQYRINQTGSMNAQETLQAILDSDKNLEAVERDEFSSDDESLVRHGRRPGAYIY